MAGWWVEGVGLSAAVLSSGGFVPQVVRVLRTKDTSAISTSTFAMLTGGAGLWFVYGICVGSLSVTVANIVAGLLAGTVLVLKLRSGIPYATAVAPHIRTADISVTLAAEQAPHATPEGARRYEPT